MSSADTPDRSEVARNAARARWVEREGNPVLVRSALTVLERADELPESLREQVHRATREAAVLVRAASAVIERADELPEVLREQVHRATGEAPGDDG